MFGVFTAWREVEKSVGDGGPQAESSRGPVQYAERTPNPAMKSESSSQDQCAGFCVKATQPYQTQ